ncbi:CidA/LrgA family protein [Nocardioides sp. AE5]|uniref:CidA/LrgA family protein n=1 Tax=Nocardioides sp. AE5 TaxID=2962573 RepID=UPI002880E2E1|nr:CidA/LrgA family protein [Nocardioides sp. AE5]MDT0200732.1 CidA/LrgA family protein [Nocardioides sp. AE5]
MLNGILWLVGCQLVGEVIARGLELPVPGPVIGMVLLFIALSIVKPPESANVFRVSDALLRHLQLLFVPAGVGVVTYLAVLRSDALPIIGGLFLSWLAGLAVVGWTVVLFTRRKGTVR